MANFNGGNSVNLRSRVDFKNYKIISLFQKVSRKKQLLNARQEQLFLPEDHCSCILFERTAKDSEEKSVGISSIGGGRHTKPSTWENFVTLMEFLVFDSHGC